MPAAPWSCASSKSASTSSRSSIVAAVRGERPRARQRLCHSLPCLVRCCCTGASSAGCQREWCGVGPRPVFASSRPSAAFAATLPTLRPPAFDDVIPTSSVCNVIECDAPRHRRHQVMTSLGEAAETGQQQATSGDCERNRATDGHRAGPQRHGGGWAVCRGFGPSKWRTRQCCPRQ